MFKIISNIYVYDYAKMLYEFPSGSSTTCFISGVPLDRDEYMQGQSNSVPTYFIHHIT